MAKQRTEKQKVRAIRTRDVMQKRMTLGTIEAPLTTRLGPEAAITMRKRAAGGTHTTRKRKGTRAARKRKALAEHGGA